MKVEPGYPLADEVQTMALGSLLAKHLQGRGRVRLRGELGAGKTTLCRGILRSMGHLGAVKSPTFTLVESYSFSEGQVYHFDLYRLNDPDELEYIGIDDYFDENNLCLVEWPEKAGDLLPAMDIEVELIIDSTTPLSPGRIVRLSGLSSSGVTLVQNVTRDLKREFR